MFIQRSGLHSSIACNHVQAGLQLCILMKPDALHRLQHPRCDSIQFCDCRMLELPPQKASQVANIQQQNYAVKWQVDTQWKQAWYFQAHSTTDKRLPCLETQNEDCQTGLAHQNCHQRSWWGWDKHVGQPPPMTRYLLMPFCCQFPALPATWLLTLV